MIFPIEVTISSNWRLRINFTTVVDPAKLRFENQKTITSLISKKEASFFLETRLKLNHFLIHS